MSAPGFDAYLRQRGFEPERPSALYRRMFVTCWGEPGFHRFWRLWNPFFGYGLFRLYLVLGGRRRPALASLVVFLTCGFLLHDLPVGLATHRVGFASTMTFGVFWLLALAHRGLASTLRQEHWPRAANAAMNIAGVVFGLVVGGLLGRHLSL